MPRFFTDNILGENVYIDGENGRHIVKSLRMRVGEGLVLCDGKGTDYKCEITDIDQNGAALKILEKTPTESEPSVFVTLYQALPKSDKMDLITQKVTELGCSRIVPVISEYCVASIKGKEDKKLERWQKIAAEAAKQSGRGIIPEFSAPIKLADAVKKSSGAKIMFYEGGGCSVSKIIGDKPKEISVFIGPEGGFAAKEVELAKENGVSICTLGPRILRTETAPITALSVIMYTTGNMN